MKFVSDADDSGKRHSLMKTYNNVPICAINAI